MDQEWVDEVQRIVSEFVQNDHDLGELMLDRSEYYWEQCFEDGLTPQQALDRCIRSLENGSALKQYKTQKLQVKNDGWWVHKIRTIFVALSKLSDQEESERERYEVELECLIDEIIQRYRGGGE